MQFESVGFPTDLNGAGMLIHWSKSIHSRTFPQIKRVDGTIERLLKLSKGAFRNAMGIWCLLSDLARKFGTKLE